MNELEYQAGLQTLRREWGELVQDKDQPGVLRATHDPTTGLLAGRRAEVLAEIINRALRAKL